MEPTDEMYVVISPNGKQFKTHGHLKKSLFGLTVLSSTFGVVAVIPRGWAVIRYDRSFKAIEESKATK